MKNILRIGLVVALVVSAGCFERRGPLERAGQEVDDTVRDATKTEKTPTEKVGDSIRDLGDRIEDSN